MEYESDTNCNWHGWYSHQRIGTGTEELEIKGWVGAIQATALSKSARILRRVLETCCHSDSSGKLSANTGMKNSQMGKIIIV